MKVSLLVSFVALLLAFLITDATCLPGRIKTTQSSLIPGKYFDRIFTIVFENTGFDATMKTSYFNSLANEGRLLTNYHAMQHPSLPNYIHMIYGANAGINDDNNHEIEG